MSFDKPAGWHVIIGDNGAGKSSIVRSISLGLMGPNEARVLRLDLNDWAKRDNSEDGEILLSVTKHKLDRLSPSSGEIIEQFDATLILERHDSYTPELFGDSMQVAARSLWANNRGWFSCAFGPFRRFTGGSKEWMSVYKSAPKVAAHLSVFGEDVALTEAIEWLIDLQFKSLENASGHTTDNATAPTVLASMKAFLNEGGLLPHGAKLDSITSEGVFFIDGNNIKVDVAQMSDGYRSILSLTFELIRQMVRAYGEEAVFRNFSSGEYTIDLPGVVLIDEVDAHLHPSWQARIGQWFVKVFPKTQFIVTTHSPLICRASENGSIWRLRSPGTELPSGEVTGVEKERLILGDLLDAYGTELFGSNITQSESGQSMTNRLARLNMKSFKGTLSAEEREELESLKGITQRVGNAATD